MNADAVPQVAGTVLPGGQYRISREENQQLCEAVGTEPAADGSAHEIYGYIATQAGMGLTVDGLLALCEFDTADGPMLGTSDSEYLRPLMTDQTYDVSGTILGLTRKASRRLGVMDVLEYRLTMSIADGEPVLHVTNTWILPRGNLDAT